MPTLTPSSDIALIVVAYLGWKLYKKTSIVRLEDIPIREALDQVNRDEELHEEPHKGPLRFVSWLWE